MKVNKWTLGLAAVGIVSLPTVSQADEKVTLSPINSAVSSTVLSGYVDTSMNWNLGTGNGNVPGFAFNTPAKQDGFNLNAVKLALEKPLDENQWSAGYKAEVLFGPNAQILGTLPGLNSGTSDSQIAIKQAYVNLRAPLGNGLDIKVGVFDTIIGYESTDGPNNPNYTRSYGYSIEPTTHTGVLGTYQLNDMFGFSAGVANSFGPAVGGSGYNGTSTDRAFYARAESYKTYMGSIAFKAPASLGFLEGSTLYAGVINGFNGGSVNGLQGTSPTTGPAHQTSWYIGGTIATPLKGLKLGASYDYAETPGYGTTEAYGHAMAAALYASFQATEKLSLHARAEYASHTGDAVAAGSTGQVFPGRVFAYTGTVQYDLWKNVLSRLEVRWDHSGDGSYVFGGTGAALPTFAAHQGLKRNAYLVAANLVYKF
jgi:Putative beta-barrel porin-2, OmpL-like. bbp2